MRLADASGASTDAGPRGGIGSMDGGPRGSAGGTGGAGGTAGTTDPSAGGPGTPEEFAPQSCLTDPELVPDAGDDACLGCLIEHCCADPQAWGCIGDSSDPCYGGRFARIRQCHADTVVSGSTESSWYVVEQCVRAEVSAIELPRDAGSQLPVQPPWGGQPLSELTHCAVGTLPQENPESDGGVGPIRAAYEAEWGDDFDPYPEANCAEECFPGWR